MKREPLDPAAAEAAAAKAAAKADKAAAKAALAAEKAAAKAAAKGTPKPRKPRKTKAQKALEEQQKKDQEAAAANGVAPPAAGTPNATGPVPTTSAANAPGLPNGLPYIKQEPGLVPPSIPGMPTNTTANSFMPPNTSAMSTPADIPTMDSLFSAPPSMVKLEDTSELAQYGIHPGHFPPPGMPHLGQFGMPHFPRGMHPAFTTAGGSMAPGMHPAFAMSGMGMPPAGMHPVTASGFLPPPAAQISSTAHPATSGNPIPVHNMHGHMHSQPPPAHAKLLQDKLAQPQSSPAAKQQKPQQKSATNKDPVITTSEIPAASTTAATAAWINQHFNQPIPAAAHTSGPLPSQ